METEGGRDRGSERERRGRRERQNKTEEAAKAAAAKETHFTARRDWFKGLVAQYTHTRTPAQPEDKPGDLVVRLCVCVCARL